MKFTDAEFDRFSSELEKTLEAFGKENQLAIEAGKIRYWEDEFTISLRCLKTDNGDARKVYFEQNCGIYGLDKSDFRREFTDGKDRFRIVEISKTSKKFPIVCENLDNGRICNYKSSLVKELLGK